MTNWPIYPGRGRTETVGETTGEGTAISTSTSGKGSWNTLGTTSFNWKGFLLQIVSSGNSNLLVDLAVDDDIVVPDIMISASNAGTNGNAECIDIPIQVASGSAIKARMYSSGSGTPCRILVTGRATDFRAPSPASRIVALNAFSGLYPVSETNFSGTAGVNTGWVEFTASCPADLIGFYIAPSGQADTSRSSSRFLLDIGVGAAGAEQVIWTFQAAQQSGGMTGPVWGPIWDRVKAGERLAWRVRNSGAAVDAIAFAAYGLVA